MEVGHTSTKEESRWVQVGLHCQVKPSGSLARLKTILDAKKYSQVYGLGYVDTFSPVAKMTSVRVKKYSQVYGLWIMSFSEEILCHGNARNKAWSLGPT